MGILSLRGARRPDILFPCSSDVPRPGQLKTAKPTYAYRLVESERSADKVRQRTLLNLGSNFQVERQHWPLLCARIRQLLDRQGDLVELDCPRDVEWHAQHIAAQLLERAPARAAEPPDLQTVDVNSLSLVRPRSVGIEALGLWAFDATRV